VVVFFLLFFFFKGTILSHPPLPPSDIFGFACEVPCSSPAAQIFLLPHPPTLQTSKSLLAMKLYPAVDWIWFISGLKFGSSRKSSSRFANHPHTHPKTQGGQLRCLCLLRGYLVKESSKDIS